ncbi:MAG: ferredoxin reductase, partial [Actinomycetota bacterium]|nr:ferredoxin reductase [Actinomycetota bacterium]
HWHSAINQGRSAARTLLFGESIPDQAETAYFWTEGFDIEVKVAGEIPNGTTPIVIEGSLNERSAILQWRDHTGPVAAASINKRMPLVKLKRLAGALPTHLIEAQA